MHPHLDAVLLIATLFALYQTINLFVAKQIVWGVAFGIATVIGILVLLGVI